MHRTVFSNALMSLPAMSTVTSTLLFDTVKTIIETGEIPGVATTSTQPSPANVNPAWWPTDHRRIPNYRQVQYHPEWHELSGNSTALDLFIFVLFKGCQLIAVREYFSTIVINTRDS